jgi:antitoxin VapB
VSLNIKNERVCRLAKQAAALAGTTQTSALEQALEAFIAEHDEERKAAERLRRIQPLLDEIAATVTDADRAWTRKFMDEMYDENGLPV